MTADAAHVAPVAEALAVEAASQGMGPGGSIHGWRCEYPDRYGPCDCIAEVSADLATVAVETLTPLIAAERDALAAEVERWVDAHAVLAREVDELRRALSVDDLAAHDEARAEELAPRITAAMLGAYGLGRDDEAAGNPVRTPLDIVENSLPADVPILGSDDPGAAQWERCDALVADLRLLCDDYDLDPRPAFGAVPVWRLRRLLDRHGPAVVPMSSDRGHDLRERIAQRIDQAWAVAKDRPVPDVVVYGAHPVGYRDGYLDGLEHAEGIARSTPLTEAGEVCTCRHPVAAHRAGQWGACDYECGCQRITTEAGERCINCSSPTCDGEACAESPYQPRATTEAGEES